MSDAGDEIKVDEVEQEVAEAPKGKLSLEDALQVRIISGTFLRWLLKYMSCSKF